MSNVKKTHWLRNTLCVLIACGILGTVISAVIFSRNPGKTFTSASVQFSFDGAAEGIAPNGNPFTLEAVSSDEVLGEALEKAGMADRYTPEQVRKYLETTGVYPENIVEQMMSYESLLDFSASRALNFSAYHPTQYSVVLYNGFDPKISKADLETLMKSILDAYRAYFGRVYAVGEAPVALAHSLDDDTFDYPQKLTILERSMTEAAAYATELYKKEPALRLNGRGFNDVAVQLNSLIATDIDQLNARITMKALSVRPEWLINQYRFSIRSLQDEMKYKQEQKEALQELIKKYEQDEEIYLSTSNGASRISSNTTETYRKLQESLEEVNDRLIAIESSIETYNTRLGNMGQGTAAETPAENTPAAPAAAAPEETGLTEAVPDETAETVEAVETVAAQDVDLGAEYEQLKADLAADITTLIGKREAVLTELNRLIAQYNSENINDLTVSVSALKTEIPSLFSVAFLKQTVKYAGALCVLGFIVCLILIIRSRRKE